MEPVRRRRFGSCTACGWIYELAADPAACGTCGDALQQRGPVKLERTSYARDEQAHVASHIKASTANVRAPWVERLATELDARHARPRPEMQLEVGRVAASFERSLPGGRETTMDAGDVADAMGDFRSTPGQLATKAALVAALMAALVALIVL